MEGFHGFSRTDFVFGQLGQWGAVMNLLEQMSPENVGERLRVARENAKFTQEDAAKAIDVARTTVVAIEQGQRPARMSELQKLAKAYGTSINALLRREAIQVDLAPRFRKLIGSKDAAAAGAAELMANLARAEVELENLLGVRRVQNYPAERPILRGDVRAQAEHDAGVAAQPRSGK